MYEQKLKLKGDNKKYGKLAKKLGFDDDLFSFLDDISKKVRNQDYAHQAYQGKSNRSQQPSDQE